MAYCLVVDDSRVLRTIAHRLFEEMRFTTAQAEDGPTALRICREKMPDLVFLNWSLAGAMPASDVVRDLRLLPNGARPMVLAAVTRLDPNEIADAVAAGIDDYVMKPFDRAALAAKLAARHCAVAR